MYNYLVHSNLVKWHYGSFSADVSLFGDRWGTEKTIYAGTLRIKQRGIVSTGSTIHWFHSCFVTYSIPGRYHRVKYMIHPLLFFEFIGTGKLLCFWMYPIVSNGNHHEESCNWGIGHVQATLPPTKTCTYFWKQPVISESPYNPKTFSLHNSDSFWNEMHISFQ